MSAYGALFSLKNTLINIFISDRLRLSPSSKIIISEVYKKLEPCEKILERLDESSKSKSRKKVNALDGRIRQIVWNFEDLLEYSLLSHQITLQSGESEGEGEGDVSLISIDLQSLQGDVDSFIQTLNNIMEEEYIYEVDNMPQDEDEDEPCISSSSTSAAAAAAGDTFGETKSKIIGLSDVFEEFERWLLRPNNRSDNIECFGLAGMAGLGKTTLARKIYEDPKIMSSYDFRVWITLGRKSYSRLNQDLRTMLTELKGDEDCLIVLDDAWKTEELSSLLTPFLEMKNTIIRVLITTRERNVITCVEKTLRRYTTHHIVLRFLNEDESKELLCDKVFGENSICPPQLVKAATKIAKKCEGLPLTIVTVADLLSKAQNTDLKYWEDVAEERNSVFKDAYTEISKVLYPSYDYLPQRFKMPFMYLGVFPRDYETPSSKIINMLTAEGW